MNESQWRDFMTRWSAEILTSDLAEQFAYLIPPAARATGWLGYPGARSLPLKRT